MGKLPLTECIVSTDDVVGDPLVEEEELFYLGKVADLVTMKQALETRRGSARAGALAASTGQATFIGAKLFLHQVYNQVQARGGLEKVRPRVHSLGPGFLDDCYDKTLNPGGHLEQCNSWELLGLTSTLLKRFDPKTTHVCPIACRPSTWRRSGSGWLVRG